MGSVRFQKVISKSVNERSQRRPGRRLRNSRIKRRRGMQTEGERVIAAWRTNNQATVYLIRQLPTRLWTREVPGIPRKTIGTIAAHLHNSRCMWIKSLGA